MKNKYFIFFVYSSADKYGLIRKMLKRQFDKLVICVIYGDLEFEVI